MCVGQAQLRPAPLNCPKHLLAFQLLGQRLVSDSGPLLLNWKVLLACLLLVHAHPLFWSFSFCFSLPFFFPSLFLSGIPKNGFWLWGVRVLYRQDSVASVPPIEHRTPLCHFSRKGELFSAPWKF